MNALAPSFLIISHSSLHVHFVTSTSTCIKSQMSSNFGQIQSWTVELAALDHLKNHLLENYFDGLVAFGLLVLKCLLSSWHRCYIFSLSPAFDLCLGS